MKENVTDSIDVILTRNKRRQPQHVTARGSTGHSPVSVTCSAWPVTAAGRACACACGNIRSRYSPIITIPPNGTHPVRATESGSVNARWAAACTAEVRRVIIIILIILITMTTASRISGTCIHHHMIYMQLQDTSKNTMCYHAHAQLFLYHDGCSMQTQSSHINTWMEMWCVMKKTPVIYIFIYLSISL